jgi:hypothetical protein
VSAAKKQPASERRLKADTAATGANCLHQTGTLHGDYLTVDDPASASCAAMFAAALAPWEGTNPLPFACEALRQVAAEIQVMQAALSDENAAIGRLTDGTIRRVLAGIEGRARVAAEVAERLGATEREVTQ